MADVDHLELSDAELDAALSRTYVRHGALRAAQQRRRRLAAGGGGLAAVAVGAVLVVASLGGAATVQSPPPADSPAATTTTLIPRGYALEQSEGGLRTLEVVDRPVAVQPTGPGSVGVSSTAVRRAAVVTATPTDAPSVVVRFDCGSTEDVVDVVRYRLDGGRLVVDADISASPAAPRCEAGDEGPSLELPLAQPLPAGTEVVAGSLHTP